MTKIELLFHDFKTTNLNINSGFFRVHFDAYFQIQSAQVKSTDGNYMLLEKNNTEFQHEVPNYIEFKFVSNGITIAKAKKYREKVLESNQISLIPVSNSDRSVYTLTYSLSIIYKALVDGKPEYVPINSRLKNKRSLQQAPQPVVDQKSSITYRFAQRLDPMVKISQYLQKIFLWQAPQLTLSFGLVLTLLILFPRPTLILLSLGLLLSRNRMINYLQTRLSDIRFDQRVRIPDENLLFLKSFMEFYCNIFGEVYNFLIDDDRTRVFAFVQILGKIGIVLIIGVLVIGVEGMAIIGVWVGLFSGSKYGRQFIRDNGYKLVDYNKKVDKMLNNVTRSSLGKVLRSNSMDLEIFKEFFVYHHQRWWLMGPQFGKWDKGKYSDQKGHVQILPRMEAPYGWTWVSEWTVQYTPNSDKQGYQYSNGLFDYLNPKFGQKSLDKALVRRRKYKRICKKSSTIQQINIKDSEQLIKIQTPQKSKIKQL